MQRYKKKLEYANLGFLHYQFIFDKSIDRFLHFSIL
jgi:hypothetical protein